jgi:hypothetical protein
MSDRWPVTVAVTRPDGSVEHVRVGTAVKQGEGFTLSLEPMTIKPEGAVRGGAPAPARSAPRAGGGGTEMVFPPYGRSKGMPISGASMQDLEFYANGSRRSLADPGKARFHEKEKVLLAAIEGEIARQKGEGGGGGGGGSSPSDDIPPPGDDDAPF